MDAERYEGIAEWWCTSTGAAPPVSGAEECVLAGLTLVEDPALARGGCGLFGSLCAYDPSLPPEVLNFAFAHELGHLLARRDGCDSEEAASHIAGAILMPRREVKHVVSRVGLDLPLVRFAFGSVSTEAAGRRLVCVYPHLALSVWVNGRPTLRYARGETPPGLVRVSEAEESASRRARDEAEPDGWDSSMGIGAWRVEERRGVAVFVLADLEMLGDRLSLAADG